MVVVVIVPFRGIAFFVFTAIVFCKTASAGASPEELRSRFKDAYLPGVRLISKKILDNRNCERSLISISTRDPVTRGPAVVEYTYFKPHREKFRTVVIATAIGGENLIDDYIAQGLCYYGSPVAILRSWTGDKELSLSWNVHDQFLLRAVIAVRHLVDALGVKDVGLYGASFGGIYGSLAMSLDKRVHRAVIVAAGSPLYKIISRSVQQHLAKLRAERMKKFNLTRESYEELLKKKVNYDPGILANSASRKNLLMIMAERDSYVPLAAQAELWNAWGRPRYFSIPSTHIWTIISAGFSHRASIIEFLQN